MGCCSEIQACQGLINYRYLILRTVQVGAPKSRSSTGSTHCSLRTLHCEDIGSNHVGPTHVTTQRPLPLVPLTPWRSVFQHGFLSQNDTVLIVRYPKWLCVKAQGGSRPALFVVCPVCFCVRKSTEVRKHMVRTLIADL